MWYVYIIKCKNGSLYTGVTTDLEKRFNAHKSGKGAKYTRAHKPQKIVFSEKFKSRGEAQKRECKIKDWDRKEKLEFIKSKNLPG